MKANIFKHEFLMHLRSVISWSLAVVVLLFIFMAVFASLAEDMQLLYDALERMPQELLIAFGMTDVDLSSVLGFYGFGFVFVQLCLALQAAGYGFGLVSVEERDLTADFLLTRPVSRPTILTSKLLAALTGLLITQVVLWSSSFLLVNFYRNGQTYDSRALVLLLVGTFVFQLFFLSVGVVVSLLMKRVRSVTTLAMALAFGMYVLSAFSGMLGTETLDVITPFKHFEPQYILSNAAFDLPYVLLSVAVIVLSLAASYVLYQRRDIHTVV